MVSWSYNHCYVHHWVCYEGVCRNVPNLYAVVTLFEASGYCGFWWYFIRKLWSVDHIIIVTFIIECALGGLLKCPKFTQFLFISCPCSKSCFGGLIEQSGYLVLGAAATNYHTKVYNCAHFWTPGYFRPRIIGERATTERIGEYLDVEIVQSVPLEHNSKLSD